MLEEIRKKVQQIVDQCQAEIVIAAYKEMIQRHKGFCGCNYCELLKRYVDQKITLSKHKRLMNAPEYDYYDSRVVLGDSAYKSKLEMKIRYLKYQKDTLKLLPI